MGHGLSVEGHGEEGCVSRSGFSFSVPDPSENDGPTATVFKTQQEWTTVDYGAAFGSTSGSFDQSLGFYSRTDSARREWICYPAKITQ